MVHEMFGLTDSMKQAAVDLAARGYLVAASDLYTRGNAFRCVLATFRALSRGKGAAFEDLAAARQALLDDPACTKTVGVLGFCMGGGFALALASQGYAASSVNYAQLPKDLDQVLAGACPIVATYGGRDRILKGVAAKLETALERNGVEHDVKEYPTAGHSLLTDSEADVPWFVRPVGRRLLHPGPDPTATPDAWRRIDEFFATHLR